MYYVDRKKFVKVFNQTREKYQLSTNQVASRCDLSPNKLYQIISSPKLRINTRMVKQIGFGLGLNPSESHYWLMKMGTVYHDDGVNHQINTKPSDQPTHQSNSYQTQSHQSHSPHQPVKHSRFIPWMIAIGILIIVLIAGSSCLSIYHHHENDEQKISRTIQKANQNSGVYDAKSLQKPSNQAIVKKLVASKQEQDRDFAKSITYNPKSNVATVQLNKPAASAINYATANHKNEKQNHVADKEKQAIKTGIQIDNRLTNQAIKIANQSHNGYFTFKFSNVQQYEAPNTAANKQ